MTRTTILALAATFAGLSAIPSSATADNIGWSVSLGGPGFAVTAGRPPDGYGVGPYRQGYRAFHRSYYRPHFTPLPPSIYYAPPVALVAYPGPVAQPYFVAPRPVYVAPRPVYVAPRPVYAVPRAYRYGPPATPYRN